MLKLYETNGRLRLVVASVSRDFGVCRRVTRRVYLIALASVCWDLDRCISDSRHFSPIMALKTSAVRVEIFIMAVDP